MTTRRRADHAGDPASSGGALRIPWQTARVCPVSRKPLDEDGMCWTCGGYHGDQRPARACGICGGAVWTDGWCPTCREHGGGDGYARVREVWYACDQGGPCPMRQADPHHRVHVSTVYQPVPAGRWLGGAEAAHLAHAASVLAAWPKSVPRPAWAEAKTWDDARAAGAPDVQRRGDAEPG